MEVTCFVSLSEQAQLWTRLNENNSTPDGPQFSKALWAFMRFFFCPILHPRPKKSVCVIVLCMCLYTSFSKIGRPVLVTSSYRNREIKIYLFGELMSKCCSRPHNLGWSKLCFSHTWSWITSFLFCCCLSSYSIFQQLTKWSRDFSSREWRLVVEYLTREPCLLLQFTKTCVSWLCMKLSALEKYLDYSCLPSPSSAMTILLSPNCSTCIIQDVE